MSSPTSKQQQTAVVVPRLTLRGHTGQVRDVVHLPCGQRIITCSIDGSLRLWDLESGAQMGDDWRDDGPYKTAAITIALSQNGTTVASGSGDGIVRLWNVETGKVIARFPGHSEVVWSVCWSADGERVVSGSFDGTVRVWDVESGETVLGPIKTGHMHVMAAMYSPDSTKIATGGCHEDAVQIWDANTGEPLATVKHDKQVTLLAWTDERKLIFGSHVNGSIKIFDTATSKQRAINYGTLEDKPFFAVSLSRNKRLLAISSSWGGTVCLWDLHTNLPVGPPLQHEDRLLCASFSADGKLLATGCNSGSLYVWDIHAILNEAGLEDLLSIAVLQVGLEKAQARKSLTDTDVRRRSAQLRDAHRLSRGFFDDTQDADHSSVMRGTYAHSSARRTLTPFSGSLPFTVISRFSSFFRNSQGNSEATELIQQHHKRTILPRRGPVEAEVAAVGDKQALFVARRPERDCDNAKQTQEQHGQSQGQTQASTSHTQPAAASTSMRPPALATSTTTASATGTHAPTAVIVENQTWWTRFLFFVGCISTQHIDGPK